MCRIEVKFMIICAICIVLILAGCASFVKNSYRTLAMSEEVYNAAVLELSELCNSGKIGAGKCLEIKRDLKQFKVAWEFASAALRHYMDYQDSKEAKDKAIAAMDEMNGLYGELQSVLKEYSEAK